MAYVRSSDFPKLKPMPFEGFRQDGGRRGRRKAVTTRHRSGSHATRVEAQTASGQPDTHATLREIAKRFNLSRVIEDRRKRERIKDERIRVS